MLVSRIVGVLCCLALCGCVWQPVMLAPPPAPLKVVQAQDYNVVWPNIVWLDTPATVHFVYPEGYSEFSAYAESRLLKRHYIRCVDGSSRADFIVYLGRLEIGYEDKRIERTSLYFRGGSDGNIMQFERIFSTWVITIESRIVAKKNGKVVYQGAFQAKIPDGTIHCDNFIGARQMPLLLEPLYDENDIERLCSTKNKRSPDSIFVKMTAEIFAGDMEELIIGLMNL